MLRIFLTIIKSFSPKKFTFFVIAAAFVILSGVLLTIQILETHTVASPTDGGTFTEGAVGQIAYLNPVLARDGSVDTDAISLLFASAYNLSETIRHDDEFKIWNIRIKENARWHDGTPVTSDDIIFTVQLIKNTDTVSPLFDNWQHISTKRISERELEFEAVNSYAFFENMLRDLRPIPKKYFADLSAANMRLSAYNMEPVGSGPFVFEKIQKRADGFVTNLFLKRNNDYGAIGSIPHIEQFNLQYFENEDALMRAFNKGILDGFGTFNPFAFDRVELNAHELQIPTSRYYGIFFNQNSNTALASENMRESISLLINKDRLVQEVFSGKALPQTGPLPEYLRSDAMLKQSSTGDVEKAHALLAADGWFFDEETGTWDNTSSEEPGEPLSFTIKIPDSSLVRELARAVQKQLEESGIKIRLEIIDAQTFSDTVLKTRDYEMIIYGNILSETPDPTSFWHSNERFYPGLNFSLFENEDVDELLGRLRKTAPDSDSRNAILSNLNDIIISKTPVVFLVSPSYLYLTRTSAIGVHIPRIATPDQRFDFIQDWYVRTKRTARS